MSHFSVFPSQGVMGVHSSCSNQSMLLCNMNNFRVHTRKIQSLGKYTGYSTSVSTFSYTSLSLSSLDCYNCCKSQNGSLYNTKVRSQINRNSGINETSSGKSEISDHKKRFSLRLRPRLRLLSNKLKRFQLRSLLKDIGIFIRKNIRSVALSASISVTLGLIFLFLKVTAVPSPKLVPYSELVLNLQKGSVSEVLFQEGSRSVFYNKVAQKASTTQLLDDQLPTEDNASERFDNMELKRDGIETRPTMGMDKVKKALSTTRVWQYSTRKVDHDESFLLSLIREKGTIYSSAPQSPLALVRNALISVLCLWIPTAPILWLFYSRFLNANSLAKKRRPDNQTVTFDDVEGVDAAKTELMEIALCLRGDIDYNRLGAKLPRGVLLSGPPGTGKTLLARAVAGEAGVPFFSVSASEFVEMFVGRGAARVRDLFGTARKNAPSIIFIDELDAVGGKRGRSLNDERDQTLNQLLTEMDGFETDTKVIVIAATNRPDALDPALCRPGRFSRKVIVGEPDEDGRRDILAVHLRGVPLEEDPYLISHLVASLTPGFVGADLANIVNEAALLAVRRGGETVAREDIMEAIERAKFGINNKQPSSSAIKAELGKLLTWMPSLKRRDDTTGPLGYQTLS